MEWSGVEWSGVEWSGVEWGAVEWCAVGVTASWSDMTAYFVGSAEPLVREQWPVK